MSPEASRRWRLSGPNMTRIMLIAAWEGRNLFQNLINKMASLVIKVTSSHFCKGGKKMILISTKLIFLF